MARPLTTRLRYVSSKTPEMLSTFLDSLGFRVQIYGAPVWDGKKWYLWFVPPDDVAVQVQSIDNVKNTDL